MHVYLALFHPLLSSLHLSDYSLEKDSILFKNDDVTFYDIYADTTESVST
jgi:hypothetical protein